MKKLFVAILALGALASCQKENVPSYADAETKTIQISILNETYTRAQGGDTEKGTAEACASNDELVVLFAKTDGTILFHDNLTSAGTTDNTHKGEGDAYVKDEDTGKYMWHKVPADVKKIAVVRFEANDITITDGTTNLSALEALAKDEAKNLNREVGDIVLYGVANLYDTNQTHRVGDAFYHVWQADVTVAPALARFEIHSISCTDLGTLNALGDPQQYDLDELQLKSLTWTGATAAHTAPGFGDVRLYGAYNPATAAKDPNTHPEAEGRSNSYAPANGAWSWNVLPCTFTGLQVDIDAYAYDYVLASRNLPLTVTGLTTTSGSTEADGNEFKAGYIYTIDLTFVQENIKAQDGICVEVVVTVKPWVVEVRYPIYG